MTVDVVIADSASVNFEIIDGESCGDGDGRVWILIAPSEGFMARLSLSENSLVSGILCSGRSDTV